MSEGPTVKATPTFKVGETVTLKGTDEDFKILAITAEGNLVLAGRAGHAPPAAFEKKL